MRRHFLSVVGFLAWILLSGCEGIQGGKIEGAIATRGTSPSFFAFGDWGSGLPSQRAVAEAVRLFCEKEHCDFGLLLGDNFYPAGVKTTTDPTWKKFYLEPYEKLLYPFYVVLGNHDHGGDIWAQVKYKDPTGRWHLPAPYYQFVAGDAAFFGLDTTRWNDAQIQWLEKSLAENKEAKWKIVFGHHPVYSYGASHGDTDYLVRDLLPVLKRQKVDLYLAGHDHDRQLLRDGADGPVFVQSGAGGAELRDVKKGPRSLFAQKSFGAAHVAIAEGTAKIRMFDTAGKVDFELVLKKELGGIELEEVSDESARAGKTGVRKARKPGALEVPAQ